MGQILRPAGSFIGEIMKITRRLLLTCFFAIAIAKSPRIALAQGPPNVVTLTPPATITAKPGAVAKASLSVTVAEGYHANSNKPLDKFLVPLQLTWAPGPLGATGVAFPKPQTRALGFSTRPVSVFTGSFNIETTFKVAADAPPGATSVTGKLHFQACDDRSCLPPRTLEVVVPVVISK